jgi:microcystin-dependent protein
MGCKNCFNGCADIISDNCVKYTGIDIPALGIENGDTLAAVESAIFTFLVPVLTGTGVKPNIDKNIICEVINQYLPVCTECTGFTLNEVLTAIIKAVCSLQNQIDATNQAIATIEASYSIGCLTGVESTSGTHNILQAVITKLCSLDSTLSALIASLPTTYVSIANINTYIKNYLISSGATTLVSSKMVPHTAMEYYGPLTQFDVTGAGTGDWLNIFLCNGLNGTPDKRGRVAVGTTSGMGGGVLSPVVDPGVIGNPAYSLGTTAGSNLVVLNQGQLPSHTHIATSTVTDPQHRHKFSDDATDPTNTLRTDNDIISYTSVPPSATISGDGTGAGKIYETSKSSTGITVATTNASTGGGTGHANIQPVIACHYIIYIP